MPHRNTGALKSCVAVLGLLLFLSLLLARPFPIHSQTIAGPVAGYAWSDTIGWIDLSCANQQTCDHVQFGLTVGADGTLSGYGWSDNVGWVSARATDLVGCPAQPCTARVEGGTLAGWLKVLSGGSSQRGGWDGFVSLKGPNYGLISTAGSLSGYAWGSTVVGWVTLSIPLLPEEESAVVPLCVPLFTCIGNAVHNSCTSSVTPCPSGYTCSAGICIPAGSPTTSGSPSATILVSPSLVSRGATSQVQWTSQNVSSCTVTENNPSIDDAWTGLSGSRASSPITQQTTYTLRCTAGATTLTRTATVNIAPVFREL